MELYISKVGSKISKKSGSFFVESNIKNYLLSPDKIEVIVLEDNISITTGAINLAIENDIPIIIADKYGNMVGHFCELNYTKGSKLRKKQYELFVSIKGKELAKKWILEKVKSQRKHIEILLKKRKRNLDMLKEFDTAIFKLQRVNLNLDGFREKIMGVEGGVGKIYYSFISEFLSDKWKFKIREHKGAKKPYNVVLNYILGILYRIVEVNIVKDGFDPAIGILHVEGHNKKSFVYDYIEQYRYLAFETTFDLFNKNFIKEDFFCYEEKKTTINISGKTVISNYFKQVLKKGKNIEGKNYSIETLIKKELKKLKKELLEEENIYLENNKKYLLEDEREVAEDELFSIL